MYLGIDKAKQNYGQTELKMIIIRRIFCVTLINIKSDERKELTKISLSLSMILGQFIFLKDFEPCDYYKKNSYKKWCILLCLHI